MLILEGADDSGESGAMLVAVIKRGFEITGKFELVDFNDKTRDGNLDSLREDTVTDLSSASGMSAKSFNTRERSPLFRTSDYAANSRKKEPDQHLTHFRIRG